MADTLEQRIENAIDQNRIVNDLGNGFKSQPAGEFLLAPQHKDLRYAILIYNIDILPHKAVFSAGMAFRDPKSNQLIAFRADQISFTNSSGLTGPAILYLIDSVTTKIGHSVSLIFLGGNAQQTFAKFDCSGIKEFGIQGTAVFNKNVITAADDTGNIITDPIAVDFGIIAREWTNIIVSVSLPPFQLKGMKGYTFRVKNAILDISETSNTNDMVFPKIYYKNNLLGDAEVLWEGFLLQDINVELPSYFKHENKKNISFGAANCIIDEFGFSGNIYAENILPFEKGNLGGWSVSVQRIEALMELNHLRSNRIIGDMGTPVMHDTSRLKYLASFDYSGNYLFTISTKGDLSIPALKALDLRLYKNSYVSAEIQGSKILLDAQLHGLFTTSLKNDNVEKARFNFPDIQFRGMRISNFGDKFGIDYLGITKKTDSSKYSNFPIQFESISFAGKQNSYCIEAGFGINITEYASGRTRIKILCKFAEENGRYRLRFDRLGLSSIDVAFEKSGISIIGSLDIFKEDVTYGNGFNGSISFSIKDPQIKATARAIFGSVNAVRYWYFDAEVSWKAPGMPIVPGLNINGFAGGAWYHIRPWNGKEPNQHPEYGTTSSGVVYVPDKAASLGFKAGVFINGGNERSYQAKVILEMQFMKNEGLSRILLYGDLEIMPEPASEKKSPASLSAAIPPSGNAWDNYCRTYVPKAQICGPFMLVLDFKNKNYTANASIHIKEAAGNTINGSYKNFKAGEINMFFGRGKWFVHVGTPLQPLAVQVSTGGQSGIKAKLYFMAGHDILPAPPPPAEVVYSLGNHIKMDTDRNLSAMSTGRGFAYGAALDMKASAGASDKKISVYASLRAIVAMDICLMDYGKSVVCKGRDKPLGIKGWYANGNLYTFFQGKVGAGVGGFKIDIMTLTGAMALSVSAPNPFYAVGFAKLEFRISSILKFDGNIKIELGEACDPQQNLSMDSSLIASVNPAHGSQNVNTLSELKVRFSAPLDQQFTTADNRNLVFRLRKIAVSSNGSLIEGKWNLHNDGLLCEYLGNSPLPANTQMELRVEIDLADIFSPNKSITDKDGKTLEEIRIFTFRTGNPEQCIPVMNIAYAYPEPGQVNFYRKQHNKGYLQLKISQDNIIGKPGTKLIARFSAISMSETKESTATHKNGRIEYDLPPNLNSNTVYKIRIIRVDQNYAITNQSVTENGQMQQSGGMKYLEKSNKNSNQITTQNAPHLLLEYYFRTSYYAHFSDKIKDLQLKSRTILKNGNVEMELTNRYKEFWAPGEINHYAPQIKITASLHATPWYIGECKNKVYAIENSIPLGQLITRDTALMGYPATRAISVFQNNLVTVSLNSANIYQNKEVDFGTSCLRLVFEVPGIVSSDLDEIKNTLASLNGKSNPTQQMAINKYVKLFKTTTPSTSQNSNQIMASLPTTSEAISKNMSKAGSSASAANDTSGNVRLASIQAIKISHPTNKTTLPIIWTYALPGNRLNYSLFQSTLIIP